MTKRSCIKHKFRNPNSQIHAISSKDQQTKNPPLRKKYDGEIDMKLMMMMIPP